VPEQLPLSEHVEDPVAIDQLDRPTSHHQHPALRPPALLEDGGSRLEVLHLHPLDELLQGLLVEPAERVVGPEELRDVVHAAYLTVAVIPTLKAIHRGYKCASVRACPSA
jgi:hypothetical protein